MTTVKQASPWGSAVRGLAAALVAACLLLPFINKPFHIDDTVFLRVAQRILEYPLAPYEFSYSWNATHQSIWKQSLHPPLHSYLLAIVGMTTGFGEIPVHLWGLCFAFGAVFLMYRLAARFCQFPMTATLASLAAPAFLVSATTAMADVPMFFFWLLAVYVTVHAGDEARPTRLWVAGLAASAAVMTKYFGIALVPLLVVYWKVSHRRARFNRSGRFNLHAMALWLPVVTLSLWGVYSFVQFGEFHPLAAADMAATYKSPLMILGNLWSPVPYLGAAILWPCWLLVKTGSLPRLWRALLANTAVAAGLLYWISFSSNAGPLIRMVESSLYAAMAATGVLVLVLCIESCSGRRDADTLLLGLWTFGTLFFAAFVNWTFNARVILPLIFPATLLIVRWIEVQPESQSWAKWSRLAVAPTAVVALLVGAADYQYASAMKEFVDARVQGHIDAGRNVYFTGHWGFQWYLEEAGAVALDARRAPAAEGDILVQKSGNDNFFPEAPYEVIREDLWFTPICLHTNKNSIHGDFYAGWGGSLPFAFNHDCMLERFRVFRVLSPDAK